MKKLLNGEYVEMTEAELQELTDFKNEQSEEPSDPTNDRVEELAEGLSKVKTLAEVRSVAKSVLPESEV